jgi:hypothetical protein
MASMIRVPITIKVGNPRLTKRGARPCVEFYNLSTEISNNHYFFWVSAEDPVTAFLTFW